MDFARTKKSPFDIKSEFSYNAYLSNGSLFLGLKKPNCIAWVETPDHEYHDHVIEARLRLDSLGGYAAAGVMFRIADESSYYLALVSSKGYFRVDVVKDSSPRCLIAWTEVSGFDGTNINLKIITYGTYLTFVVNDNWVGETSDDSINSGQLGFVLASYEGGETGTPANEYTCKAMLDFLSVDPQTKTIENNYKKWNDDSNINAENRLRLAETFAVMGDASKALNQINKAWKRRDETISSVTHNYTEVRTRKELLLAARMSFQLEQYREAEEFIDAFMEQWTDSVEGREALTEKIKILNELDKFEELKEFTLKYYDIINRDIGFYTLLARCYWEMKEYENSAGAWQKAFEMNKENGVYAVNAANALELAGKSAEALELFLEAGRLFLKHDNKGELEAMMPKLAVLGKKNWEARVLAGKWAFSIEDYDCCVQEFTDANKLRCAIRPRPKADPAHFYLWGLVLNLKGKNSEALRMLERAVKLAPDYGLFRFKLTEIKLINGISHPNLAEELKLALEHIDDDMKTDMAAHAGNLLFNAGDKKNAAWFFNKAEKQ